ncbi:MAG: RluA family pseudouridine synthase [Rhodospirillales bacterium]|nr:RluA family pseudouridine synthase [Alphaproteobacteria bacterium]MCB9986341.1 RluA family pseudouridine synthase [Rhodospirillales bacterium]USO07109.1 MAG: RluA family pseudouridine synthase [Rhodospirillales bacterium]
MSIVQPDDDGQRLDRWLKKNHPQIPFGQVQKLLRTGQVRVDGKRVKPDTRLKQGQDVRLPPALSNSKVAAKTVAGKDATMLRKLVIHEDEDLIAINKPAGLAVQGGPGITRHIDGMLGALAGANGVRPRLVHRLDRDTSGVLLLARSAEVARRLGAAFAGRDVEKIYIALTCPGPAQDSGRVDAALAKGQSGGALEKMMPDDAAGRAAITDYRVLARGGMTAGGAPALVEFHPLTGRTHQIRVHAALLGAPLWGDRKYGARVGDRFYLHARELRLTHPKTGAALVLKAALPPDFQARARALGLSLKVPAKIQTWAD